MRGVGRLRAECALCSRSSVSLPGALSSRVACLNQLLRLYVAQKATLAALLPDVAARPTVMGDPGEAGATSPARPQPYPAPRRYRCPKSVAAEEAGQALAQYER